MILERVGVWNRAALWHHENQALRTIVMITVPLLTFCYTTIILHAQDLQKSSLLLSLWLLAIIVIIFQLISCTEKPYKCTYLSGSQEINYPPILYTESSSLLFLKSQKLWCYTNIIWRSIHLLISATINIGWHSISCIWNFRFHVNFIMLTNVLGYVYLTSMAPVRVAIVGSSRKTFEAIALSVRHQWAHFYI
jgi:hypothetical protein